MQRIVYEITFGLNNHTYCDQIAADSPDSAWFIVMDSFSFSKVKPVLISVKSIY